MIKITFLGTGTSQGIPIIAYDKNFSDNIYGEEDDKRYVTEARLNKMLDHEMQLLEDRIPREDNPNKMFFTLSLIHI